MTVAVAVDPEMTGSAAPIAFPLGRFAGVASQNGLAVGPNGDSACRTVAQRLELAIGAISRDLEEGHFSAYGLAMVAGKEDMRAGCIPAEYLAAATKIGEAARRAADGRHDIDFFCALFSTDECQLFAIRRQ